MVRKKASRAPETVEEYLAGLQGLNEKDEPPNYARLADALFGDVSERIPTGSLALDRLTGGGWPVGRIIEVCAWEGVGKSTLLDQAAAQVQRLGGVPVLIDSERARDLAYTAKLGVALGKCILAEAEDVEEAFQRIDEVIALQEKKRLDAKAKEVVPPVLIVWDSLGGTPAREELEGAPDDDHVSPAARLVSMNLRRIVGRLIENRTTLVFANHFYKTIGGMGQLVAFGGKGVRYYTSLRVWLSRTENLKIGDRIVGHEIEAKLRKTRVGKPRAPTTLGLVHGMGIDNAYTLFEWGKLHGVGGEHPDHRWVVSRGRYNYLVVPGVEESITFERGFIGLGQVLAENQAAYQQLAAAYLASED